MDAPPIKFNDFHIHKTKITITMYIKKQSNRHGKKLRIHTNLSENKFRLQAWPLACPQHHSLKLHSITHNYIKSNTQKLKHRRKFYSQRHNLSYEIPILD